MLFTTHGVAVTTIATAAFYLFCYGWLRVFAVAASPESKNGQLAVFTAAITITMLILTLSISYLFESNAHPPCRTVTLVASNVLPALECNNPK